MKLTTIILFIMLMQASAAGYGQKITLREKNTNIEKVLRLIKQQSGYVFFYNRDDIPKINISVEISQATIEEALKASLENLPLTYQIVKNSIFLTKISTSIIDGSRDALAQQIISGIIRDEKGEILPGATIKIKESNVMTTANRVGRFSISVPDRNAVLIISFIGYITKEVKIPQDGSGLLEISLEVDVSQLQLVNVVSTGYQTLPKERATGSFEKISNGLFNRTTSTDIFSRLNGTVAGLYFNTRSAVTPRGFSLLDGASIRGISSLSVVKPLLILDNVPYEGDPNNINPNDIEDVTILKDAAAASIWGARAGNGVIVMTTKKGVYDKPLQVSINSNVSVVERPDLFYLGKIGSSDFIDVEKFLFEKGYYTFNLGVTNPYPLFFTPVVELLAKQSSLPANDLAGRQQIDNQINELRKFDIRNDYNRYIYRKGVNQQYSLNINGGGKEVNYMLSAGYDKNLNNLVRSDADRLTLRSDVRLKPVKNMEIQTGLLYTLNSSRQGGFENYGTGFLANVYPYARMADDQGNALAIGKNYRTSYLDNLSTNPKLLDWRYKPLEELDQTENKIKVRDVIFNLGSTYTFSKVFSLDLKYQYVNTNSENNTLNRQNSFYTRDLINLYTAPGTFIRSIPLGAIYRPTIISSSAQTVRGQINVNKNWSNKHNFNAIAGAEARRIDNLQRADWYYGYKEDSGIFSILDVVNNNKPYYYGGNRAIPYSASIDKTASRFTSMFANAAYTYNNLYTLSASARKDAANVLGNVTNKRGAPLWSAGVAWNISNERFYKLDILPYLKFRTTYGYSGNVNNSVFAFPVITYQNPLSTTNLPYATISGLANPDLRWEKVRMLNFGFDYAFKSNRISGSIEYYDKRSSDVIANAPIDPTKGSTFQTFNTANIHGKGIDLTVNSVNIRNAEFQWLTTSVFSYNRNIVTKYLYKTEVPRTLINAAGRINPIEGKDAYAVVANRWAGLNHDTGDPQGYLNGEVSKNYNLLNQLPAEQFQYFGSAVPIYFGSLRNSFTYKKVTISANILYKFDYYFLRNNGLNYSNLFVAGAGTEEFSRRWKQPGDEINTNVPSMVYPVVSGRDLFYNTSAVMVEKGDHIRLQDITVDYTIKKIKGLQNIRLYSNISNVGILWRANNKGIDPDIATGYRSPLTMAIGFNANF